MFRLIEAERVAQELIEAMKPYCIRCEVAGSIRRQKPEVKDIEIVAIPLWHKVDDPTDLFCERKVNINELWQNNSALNVKWIKPGTSEIVPWHINQNGKYWRGLLPNSMKLDLFLVTEANWGIQFAIRTGCAEFSHGLVTHANRRSLPCVDGYLTREGQRLETREEIEVFNLLDLDFVEPQNRVGFAQVRARSASKKSGI